MAGYWPNSFSRGAAKMSDKELERETSGRNFLSRTCLSLRQEDSPTDIFEGNKRSSRSRRRNRQPESVEFRYLSVQRKIPIRWWRLSRNGIGLVLFCFILNEIIFLEVIKRFCNHQTCTSWKWKTLTHFEYFNLTVNSCAYWVLAHNGRTIISVELTSLLDWRKNSRKIRERGVELSERGVEGLRLPKIDK